ncbi:MAG TPA: flagellar hook-associated protein FlgK [Holophagaceae bacterium]
MPGLNAGLFVGLSGLQAQQSALNVVGNNIANVNTPSYSRQRADLSASQALGQAGVYFGTGVTLNDVQGIRNQFLDLQIYRETARESGASDRYAGLNAVAPTLGDSTSTGVAAQIQSFFQGFQNLAAKPEDTSLRTNLIGQAQSMITGMQSQYRMLDDQRNTADLSVKNLVNQVNTLTSQIAQLNQTISTEVTPGSRNDARDQRTALTNQLAQLVGINVTEGSHGEYQITLDSGVAALVNGNTTYQLSTSPDPALDGHLRVSSTMGTTVVDVTSKISDGSLGAQLDLRDNIYPGYQRQLDQLAAGIASRVNLLHRTGFAADGVTTGTDFFQSGVANGANGLPAVISAATNYKGMVYALSVNAAVAANPNLIAAAGVAGAVGDNTNANAMANLQFASGTVDTNGDGVGDSGPYSSVAASLVGDVGTKVQSLDAQSTTQQNLVTALKSQRDSISGVDLNEEAASMMTLQQGYQASGRFLTVINQLMDQLVNNFGR